MSESDAWLAAERERDSQQRMVVAELRQKENDLIRAIKADPIHFFTWDESFGTEVVSTAHAALAGKNWLDYVRMAYEGERRILLKNFEPEIVDALIEFGWVWRHENTCLSVRDKAIVSGFKPRDSMRMIFVLKGHSWEPSRRLLLLAEMKLRIPCPTLIGNVRGSHLAGKVAGVRALRSYADFLIQHGTDKFRDEAEAQLFHCDRLLRMLTPQSDSLLVEAAMNVVRGDSDLREQLDSGLIEDIIRLHGKPRSKKGATTGLRILVVNAYLTASRMKARRASKDDVIAEIRKSHEVGQNPKGHLVSIDGKAVTDATLNEWLEDIRPQFSELYPPPSKGGRPQKEKVSR